MTCDTFTEFITLPTTVVGVLASSVKLTVGVAVAGALVGVGCGFVGASVRVNIWGVLVAVAVVVSSK